MLHLGELRSALIQSRWEFKSRHNLAASAAETMLLSDLRATAAAEEREDLERLSLGYGETSGDTKLRRAIAATYGVIAEDDVLCFSGGKEAIFTAFHALMEAGDHAVIVTPAYQPAEDVPLSAGMASGVALRAEDDWRLDLDRMRAALRPNTRVIYINFPHNPTGALPDRGTFDALVALAAEREIHVLSDEVYRGLELDPAARLPQIADAYPRGLSLNVTSKTLGLPGLRVAWIACKDRALLDRITNIKHYLSDGNAGVCEVLARIALKAADRIVDRNRAVIASNLPILDAFFREHADLFDWRRPDGGCVAYPRYKGPDGVEEFCRRAVEKAGILLLPASAYRSRLTETPTDRFRIGFGKRGMEDGIAALHEFIGKS
jgi:aspartate/methionine/tyrosine aminotransferase